MTDFSEVYKRFTDTEGHFKNWKDTKEHFRYWKRPEKDMWGREYHTYNTYKQEKSLALEAIKDGVKGVNYEIRFKRYNKQQIRHKDYITGRFVKK